MKTLLMQFRVSEQEKALIEKCAKKADMTVSEYVRVGMLMEMMLEGETEAFKIIGRAIGQKAFEALRRHVRPDVKVEGSKA